MIDTLFFFLYGGIYYNKSVIPNFRINLLSQKYIMVYS